MFLGRGAVPGAASQKHFLKSRLQLPFHVARGRNAEQLRSAFGFILALRPYLCYNIIRTRA